MMLRISKLLSYVQLIYFENKAVNLMVQLWSFLSHFIQIALKLREAIGLTRKTCVLHLLFSFLSAGSEEGEVWVDSEAQV